MWPQMSAEAAARLGQRQRGLGPQITPWLSRAVRLLQFGVVANAHGPPGKGLAAAMNHQFEAVRQKRLQHDFQLFGRRVGQRLGDHVKPVEFHPTGAAIYLVFVHPVGKGNQLHHAGGFQFIAHSLPPGTPQVGRGTGRAGMHVRDLKAGLRLGLPECRAGQSG